MAHQSRYEQMKNRIKANNKVKAKKKAEWNAMEPEERAEKLKRKYEITLKDKVRMILWDLERNQYPFSKYAYAANLFQSRLDQIQERDETNSEEEQNNIKRWLKNVSGN